MICPENWWDYREAKARDNRIFYIVNGSGKINISGECHDFCENSAIVISGGTTYEFQFDRKGEERLYVVNFDYTFEHCHLKNPFELIMTSTYTPDESPLETVYFDDFNIFNKPVVVSNLITARPILEEMIKKYNSPSSAKDIILSGYAKILIGLIAASAFGSDSRKNKRLEEIVEYLHENYTLDISNKMIAEKFNYHPKYLYSLLHKRLGTSPHSYIVGLRIDEAARLLYSTNMSIEEISRRVGFKESTYFCTVFKRLVGITPSQYRKMI